MNSGRDSSSSVAGRSHRAPAPTLDPNAASFLAVWLPSIMTSVASGLCLVSLSWWITRSPDGGAHLGLIVGAASLVSLLLVLALAGTVDRSNRQRIVTALLSGLLIAAVLTAPVLQASGTWVTILAAALCYVSIVTGNTLYLAAVETSSADLAPRDWPSERTATFLQMQPQLERSAAPIIAGTIIAAGALVAVPVVAACVVVLVLASVWVFKRHWAMLAVADSGVGPALRDGSGFGVWRRDTRDSLRFIRSRPQLLFMLGLGVQGSLLVFPLYVMIPAFMAETGVSQATQARMYGHAASAYGVGMIVGTAFMALSRRRKRVAGSINVPTFCLAFVCMILFLASFTRNGTVLTAVMPLVGAVFVAHVASVGAVWLDHTPAATRVRVFSLRRLAAFSTIPLGTTMMGFGGAAMGYFDYLKLISGLVLLGVACSWLAFSHRFPTNIKLSRSDQGSGQ